MLIKDNQQVTSGWMAGIIESEGSFSGNYKGCRIRISNTNLEIINKCVEFLNQHRIQHRVYNHSRPTRKIEYDITIETINNCYHLYKIINDKIECRKSEFHDTLKRTLGTSTTLCPVSTSIDIDWLSGAYEGEGSLSLRLNNKNVATLSINICNTNPLFIQKVIYNLKAIGCSWYVRHKNHSENEETPNWKNSIEIIIYGMKRCQRFLYQMENRWQAERNIKRSNLMIEFIQSRMKRSQKESYNDREYQIIQSMDSLNKRSR